ncbi:AsmA-like C-terminal region-containing protein [Chitinophaga sp.]|uniref:AsmA family protein n=1 Tax=Chitinophaga sp. TaxID=1869181 RepID=UPI0031D7B1C0
MLKKILKVTGILLLVLIVAAIAIPFLFKGKIMSIVKTELNKQLEADVDFKDVDISLIRHFPRLAVALEDLQVVNRAPFVGDTLISVKKIDVALNLMSVIKGETYDIYNINVDAPRIHAIINKDGKANWDITKPDTARINPADTAATKFAMSLQQYKIEDAYIEYTDRQGDMSMIIENLDHSGKGDFTQDLFTLTTSTEAEAVTFRYGLIPYLLRTHTKMDADIKVDNKTNTYTIQQAKASLNNLQLTAQGSFTLVNDSTYGMDLSMKAPSTQFKDILSLVPAIFMTDFEKIKTSGTATFDGFVKGTYSATQMPAFGLNLQVKDGFFQYPDLPKPVKNIQIALKVNNPDGVPDHTVIDMPAAHLDMDNTPLDLRLLVKTPISDMYIDGAAKGSLDLSKVTQFVKLDEGTAVSGIVDADVSAKGNMSAIEKQQYDRFYAAGSILVTNLLYRSKDYPDGVKVNNLSMKFNPKNVTVESFDGQYMGTNFKANGAVNNMLAYAFKNEPLDGNLTVKADQIDLNKWMGTETTATATTDTPSAPFAVPANLNLSLNATADKVRYDQLDLTNVSGALLVKDQTVTMQQVKANAMQGTMEVNGSYSTKANPNTPDISMSYNVQQIDIQQAFKSFNTVQKLMPIAQFIGGKVTSQLSMKGQLGKDMMPILNSLNGDGNLFVLEGALQKFGVVDQLANTLNVTALKNLSLKDLKTYFSFENGRVKINPFTLNFNGMHMQIGGSHGFDQSLDYTMLMTLPRSVIGKQGDALITSLTTQASNKGIPVNVSDSIHLNVLLGGNILKPTYKTNLQETAGNTINNLKDQAATLVKNKVDTVKTAIKDTLQSVKNQAVNTVKEAAKEELAKQLLGGKKDTSNTTTTTNKAEDLKNVGKEAVKGIGNIFKKKSN